MNENFLGRNILPVVAAGLGLIGLIFLGILVVPHLTDAIKIVLMFLISIGVGGLGYLLGRRHSTVLTRALIGTGLGGIFISILVTHLYFHLLNDIAAFALLAVWILVSMWLAKHVGSLLIASLAHAGMVASIAAGLLGGMSDDKLILLLVYQFVATATVIVGNMVWVRSMYRFGLFASQIMVIVSLAVMWSRFMGTGPGFDSGLPPAIIVAAFLVQFVGASAIAYLLFVSCARVKDPTAMGLLGMVNTGMWVVVVVLSVTVLISKLVADSLGLSSLYVWRDPRTVGLSLAVSVVWTFLPALLVTLGASRLGLKPALEHVTMITLGASSMALLMANFLVQSGRSSHATPLCSWLITVGLAYLVLALVTRSMVSAWISRALLLFDAVLMLAAPDGYASMTGSWTVWASLGYLGVLIVAAYLQWRLVTPTLRARYDTHMLVAAFGFAEVSLIAIVATANLTYSLGLLVVTTAAALAVVHLVNPGAATTVFRVAELVTLLIGAGSLYTVGWDVYWNARTPYPGPLWPLTVTLVLDVVGTVILLVVLADRVRLAAQATSAALRTGQPRPATALEVLSGVGMTIGVVGLLSPYDWFVDHSSMWSWGYPFSLACMVVALVVVGLGLWSRVKALRLYGLVQVIVCVLKLVTIDLGSVTPVTRVVAFLGGAAVCFGISALYSYTARHFDKDLAVDPMAPMPSAGPGLAMATGLAAPGQAATPGVSEGAAKLSMTA